MKHNHLLLKIINNFFPDNKLVGVEIGVDHADLTTYLLKNCSNLKHLYAVDPFVNRDHRYLIVKEDLNKYSNCTLIRKTSNSAINEIPDNLDFIFIDGDHSYKAVLSDLENYVPKIKSGGLLTGHDWTHIRKDFGVVQAGTKYLSENENIFQSLFSNDALKNMGFQDFQQGGWDVTLKRCLIHKKYPSNFPLWWLVKK